MNLLRLNRLDIVIDNMNLISYHQDVIHLLHLYYRKKTFFYGIKSRVIAKQKNDEIMEVNILAFIATMLFILVPTAFLLIIYVKTISQKTISQND